MVTIELRSDVSYLQGHYPIQSDDGRGRHTHGYHFSRRVAGQEQGHHKLLYHNYRSQDHEEGIGVKATCQYRNTRKKQRE